MGMIFKIEYPSAGDLIADQTRDISEGGIFVTTTKDFAVGDNLAFDLSFPGLVSPIRCQGEVRWRRPPEEASEDNPAGIGVAFVFPSDELQRLLDVVAFKLPEHAPAGIPQEPYQVLFAESDRDVRESFRAQVQNLHEEYPIPRDLSVVEAEDGSAAWDRLTNGAFDLAIIDESTPEMKGQDLLRKIRADKSLRSLPVLVVTSDDPEAEQQAYASGADLVLQHPTDFDRILESLGRLAWCKR
jgi:uncharacterized protein (TIGR02266 family)